MINLFSIIVLPLVVCDLNNNLKQEAPLNNQILKQLNNSLKNISEFENFRAGSLSFTENNKISIEGSYFLNSKSFELRKKHLENLKVNALLALKNAYEKKQIPILISDIDVSDLINSSDDPAEQARQIILRKVLVDDLNDCMVYTVRANSGNSSVELILEGFVTKYYYRSVIAEKAAKVLMRYKKLDIISFEVSGINANNLKNYPNIIVYELMRNLQNLNGVSADGMELFHAEIDDNYNCIIVGLFKDQGQLDICKNVCLKAIINSYELESNYVFRDRVRKPKELDATYMKVGLSWENRTKLIEDFMTFKKVNNIKIQSFEKNSGTISLCGVASSNIKSKYFIDFLERISGIKSVDSQNLFLKSRRSFGRDTDILYGDLVFALTRYDFDKVLKLSAIIIEHGGAENSISANAWYLRAAAHLMLGDKKNAVGDLKLGDLLFGDYAHTMERFQGDFRNKLSELRKDNKSLLLIN